MKAVEISSYGGPEVLRPVERPSRSPGRRSAGQGRGGRASTGPTCCSARAAIRRRQALPTCRGSRSPARSSALGPASPGRRVGDEVCALIAGGGYAEYCVAPAASACRSRAASHDRGGGAARDLLHRLDQRVRPRPPKAGRDASSSMAAPAASASPRSSSPRRSAPRSSPPPAPPRNAAACEALGAA